MNPEIGKIALMLLSLLIFAILVSGVCSFFANNVIRSIMSRSPKAILLSALFEAVLVALALFVLSGIKETLRMACRHRIRMEFCHRHSHSGSKFPHNAPVVEPLQHLEL